MGAYVSIAECKANYNVTLNCDNQTWNDGLHSSTRSIGGIEYGKFQPDPDIAGIGVSSPSSTTITTKH